MKAARIILALALAALVAGCATSPGQFDPKANFSGPPPSTNLAPPPPTHGSLFTESRGDFYADLRARHVGDIVIVEVVENSKAKKKNDTKAERTNEFQAGIPNLLGYQDVFPPQRGTANPSTMVKADFTSKHDAKAELTKEDTMTSSIGCTVIEVLPNGNLVLRGSRELQVNGETQYITLQGVVQPSDISGTNTVQSTRLADARIYYTGRGVLTDKQTPGWLARLLDTIWPF